MVYKIDLTFFFILALFMLSLVFLVVISRRLVEKFEEDDPMLSYLRSKVQPVYPDMSNVILLRGKKSYTINKKRIHLCLRDEKGDYYDKNMLTYVLLHELAHVRCPEIGHTEEFHRIFNDILKTAIEHGIYDPTKPIIKDYCEYSKE